MHRDSRSHVGFGYAVLRKEIRITLVSGECLLERGKRRVNGAAAWFQCRSGDVALALQHLVLLLNELIFHERRNDGLRDGGLLVICFVCLDLRGDDLVLRVGVLVALRRRGLVRSLLLDLALQRVPENLRVVGKLLLVGCLGNTDTVDGNDGFIRNDNVLLDHTEDKDENNRDDDQSKEAENGPSLNLLFLHAGELLAPPKYQRCAIAATVNACRLSAE